MNVLRNFIEDLSLPDRISLVGKRFGKLVCEKPVGYLLNDSKRTVYLFKCDCGNTHLAPSNSVVTGRVKSCGCIRKDSARLRGKSNKLPNCQGQKNLLYYRFLSSAKKRKKEVFITQAEFESFIFKTCHYCGSAPSNFSSSSKAACKLFYTGLDRIDSKGDYTMSNLVPCCKFCN